MPSGSGFATPGALAYYPGDGPDPLTSTGPVGYRPAQIRHAYGFDRIALNGTPGDGAEAFFDGRCGYQECIQNQMRPGPTLRCR